MPERLNEDVFQRELDSGLVTEIVQDAHLEGRTPISKIQDVTEIRKFQEEVKTKGEEKTRGEAKNEREAKK
ncbi:hypothetical protein GLOIN_2v1773140 [Rhizophagus irregularis DAOM 181602=DAOM 197198]|uniref:Uncharacterized protein n=1 Tax=Rhizophagus irregularis (strain DAOM 181602 / DAOM 197198 / MUCL 43194) TaxID=747089 RepID=A0A2P4Q5D2_RHIID|nr:hypothetical protein GLOIN_2v1773140 [Rhizophagus irregularis DAOM 181602=DAOM 197198]POG72857.1 hypothetical protein GLOIN_2v1773140 [Rhizophagus irregularis DAOM 181602=DAOM 197198]|eukprot:XP_025179723.1 hypothetical protein GLOIN_2v1773140 [Rhizophagus irregularis DAOM 181602=DAOM 197198]